jgi:flagellar hook-associated protein 1
MGDLLGIASSGLSAAQSALDLTSNNISNVNTPNYSRQRLDQSSRVSGGASQYATGDGVKIDGTQRLNDSLLEARLVRDGSEVSRLDTLSGIASSTDTVLSDSSSGLSKPLSSFFASLQDLAADPSSSATRQAALGQATALASRFTSLQGQLDQSDQEIDTRLRGAVNSLNADSTALAKLNNTIAGQGQNPSADLLDQRDALVQKMAALVGISTVRQDDGSLNVFTSSGQPLVVGAKANALGTASDIYRPSRTDITVGTARITNQLSGGTIGGLLDARRNVIDPAYEQLGRIAVTLTSRINAVQAQGVTADGSAGTNVFTPITAAALPASTNTGTASASVSFADLSAVTGEDYTLRYDGSQWQMTGARSGQSVTLSGNGSAASPFTAAGLSIVVSGTPAAGDSLRISPTHSAASQVQLAASDGSMFATAGAMSGSASLANTGSAKVAATTVIDSSNAALSTPATISFVSASTYQIGSGPVQSYTAGQAISANGWSLTLSGTPAAGDSFSVAPTAAGSSDNRNANALAALGSERLLDGGKSTLAAANSALVTQTGSTAQQASAAKDAATAVQTQNQTQRDAVSGVNLDEEVANLQRFQQAYQAAAQVITIASTVFESILAATRS